MQQTANFEICTCNTDDLKKAQVLVSEFFSNPDNRTPECFDAWEKGIRTYKHILSVENNTDVHAAWDEYEDLLPLMIVYVVKGLPDTVIAGRTIIGSDDTGEETRYYIGIFGDLHWIYKWKDLHSILFEDRLLPTSDSLAGKNVVFSQLNLAKYIRYSNAVIRSGGFVRDFTSAKTGIVVHDNGVDTPDVKKAEELNQKKPKVKVFTCEEFEQYLVSHTI